MRHGYYYSLIIATKMSKAIRNAKRIIHIYVCLVV